MIRSLILLVAWTTGAALATGDSGRALALASICTAVVDAAGRPIPDLVEQDFDLSIDGSPMTFRLSPPALPVRVLLLFDFSNSARAADRFYSANEYLTLVTNALTMFGAALRPGDGVKFASFAERVIVSRDFVPQGGDLHGAVRSVFQIEGPSPLWDAIVEILDALPPGGDARPVLIVVTDGRANVNRRGSDDARLAVRASRTTLFGVFFASARLPNLGGSTADAALREMAASTGGRLVMFRAMPDLGRALVEAVEEARAMRCLEFDHPAPLPTNGRVDLRVRRPGATIRVSPIRALGE